MRRQPSGSSIATRSHWNDCVALYQSPGCADVVCDRHALLIELDAAAQVARVYAHVRVAHAVRVDQLETGGIVGRAETDATLASQ